MISVLIPTYNYNITELVCSLHEQLELANIEFEILAFDDASDNKIQEKNSRIETLSNTSYIISAKNKGIAIARQTLCKKSKFEWIILIDADVELKNNNYISNYITAIKKGHKVIFGGICYKKSKPPNNQILRWEYGKRYEEKNAKKRNLKPYKTTSGANLCIKKDIYLQFGLDNIGNKYGIDLFFGIQLKTNTIKITHIDNCVFHLGLEDSDTYFKKMEKGVKTLLGLYYSQKNNIHENSLLNAFVFLKKTKLNYLLIFLFKIFKKSIKKNLLSSNPKIIFLQFYKIGYMCYSDNEF